MDHSGGRTEPTTGRRSILKAAGVGAAAAWASPMLLSTPAAASSTIPPLPFVALSVGGTTGAWRSVDGGASWQAATTPLPGAGSGPRGLATDGSGRWIAALNVGAQLGLSTDDGDNWSPLDPGIPATELRAVATDGNGRWIVVGTDPDPDRRCIRSLDDGATWSYATTPPDGLPAALARAGTTWIAVGSSVTNTAWRSTDDGDTWSPINPPSLVSRIDVATDGTTWSTVGEDFPYAFYSTDAGSTWSNATMSAPRPSVATNSAGNWVALGIGQPRVSGDAQSWFNGVVGPDGLVTSVATDNAGNWVAVGSTFSLAWRSTDNGFNWQAATVPVSTSFRVVRASRLLP